jgi:prepilin peptidase CpaA
MPAQVMVMQAPLVVLLLIAAAIDVRARRIPNWLTISLLVTGMVQSFTTVGLVTPAQALLGALVGLALPLVLHMLGGLAAGDVKLLCGIGAWVGPRNILLVLAAAALAGLILVLVQATVQRRLMLLMRNTGLLILSLINLPRLGLRHVIETGQRCQSVNKPLPYAVTVLVGTVGLMVLSIVTAPGGWL